jgi:hypothetical protein
MSNLMLVGLAAIIAAAGTAAAGDPFLYAGDSSAGALYTIDKANGATIETVPVTIGGEQVASIKGLAALESTGELFAVVIASRPTDQPPVSDFRLVTITPDTGVATEIGVLGDRFAGLAWGPYFPTEGQPPWTETLFGVTGDGATNPEQLFVIDHTTATTMLLWNLGNGGDGEAIAYNPDDNMIYHLSGGFGSDLVFEKIDHFSGAVTAVPLSGAPFVNGNGLVYDAVAGEFLFSALVDNPNPQLGDQLLVVELFSLSPTGAAASLGPLGAHFGGMAFTELIPVELQSFTIE